MNEYLYLRQLVAFRGGPRAKDELAALLAEVERLRALDDGEAYESFEDDGYPSTVPALPQTDAYCGTGRQ
jgi:hypothetical protein